MRGRGRPLPFAVAEAAAAAFFFPVLAAAGAAAAATAVVAAAFLAVEAAVAALAFGFWAGDFFLVTLLALGFMTLGVLAFLGVAAFWGVVAFLAVAFFSVATFFFGAAFFGVGVVVSSIRRSGLPGSESVAERVLRVDRGTVAEDLVTLDFDFWMDISQNDRERKRVRMNTASAFAGQHTGGIPPRSRGRDSLAIMFLAADFMSPPKAPGVVGRPGVIALIGEPCLAGVVARDTAMFVAPSTNETSPEAKEPKRKVENGCSIGVMLAVMLLKMRAPSKRAQGKR